MKGEIRCRALILLLHSIFASTLCACGIYIIFTDEGIAAFKEPLQEIRIGGKNVDDFEGIGS
jgi:hypothetical protein